MMVLFERWNTEGKCVAIRADAILSVFDVPDKECSEVSYTNVKGEIYTARVKESAALITDLVNDVLRDR